MLAVLISSEGLLSWLVDGRLLPVSPYGLPWVCVCVPITAFYKDMLDWVHLMTSFFFFTLIMFLRSYIQMQSHLKVLGVRISTYEF